MSNAVSDILRLGETEIAGVSQMGLAMYNPVFAHERLCLGIVMRPLLEQSNEELRAWLAERGEPAYRAEQIRAGCSSVGPPRSTT